MLSEETVKPWCPATPQAHNLGFVVTFKFLEPFLRMSWHARYLIRLPMFAPGGENLPDGHGFETCHLLKEVGYVGRIDVDGRPVALSVYLVEPPDQLSVEYLVVVDVENDRALLGQIGKGLRRCGRRERIHHRT